MKKRMIFIVAGVVIAIPIVLYALIYTPTEDRDKGVPISQAELAKNNGLDGNECWVAVDGVVYSISGFSEWQMGRHIPSEGKATCGRDLSGVIGESPHGKSVLQLLKQVGTLEA